MTIFPLCILCKHINKHTCTAFTKGVPREIFLMSFLHIKPYKNDNGIIFEPKDKESERLANIIINNWKK